MHGPSQDPKFLGNFRDHLLDLPVSKKAIHGKFFRHKDEILQAENIKKLGRYCNEKHFKYTIYNARAIPIYTVLPYCVIM